MRWMLLAAMLLLAAPARADPLVLEAASGFVVDATINGQPVRLRVDPALQGAIMLNPGAARRLKLKGSILRVRALVGPVGLTGRWGWVALALRGGKPVKTRVGWFDRPIAADVDGTISPGALPVETVTLNLASSVAGERRVLLPTRFDQGLGLIMKRPIGGANVDVRVSIAHPDTLATAAAGAAIAAAQDGRLTGAVEPRRIVFDVDRPTRALAMARPLVIDGLVIDGLRVRTSDFRGDGPLPPDADLDPSEVLVLGGETGRAVHRLTIGRDTLRRCSSIRYARAEARLTLSCAR